YRAALKLYSQISQNNWEERIWVWIALNEKGDREGASREIQALQRIGSHAAGAAHLYRGDFLMRRWDVEGATREYQAAVDLVPNNADALRGFALVLRDQGRFAEALQMFKRVDDLGKGRPNGYSFVPQVERLVELDAKLPMILGGKTKAKNA